VQSIERKKKLKNTAGKTAKGTELNVDSVGHIIIIIITKKYIQWSMLTKPVCLTGFTCAP